MGKKTSNSGMVPAGVKHTQGQGWSLTWKTPSEIFASWQEDARELREKMQETDGNLKICDVRKVKVFASNVNSICSYIFKQDDARSNYFIRKGDIKVKSYDFLKITVSVPDHEYENYCDQESYETVILRLHSLAVRVENFEAIHATIFAVQNIYNLVDFIVDLADANKGNTEQ